MNQQQLDAIKARVEAAHADNGPVDLEKVKAMALFRQHAIYDVTSLIAEVERLQVQESILTGIAAELKAMLTEAQEETEWLRAILGECDRRFEFYGLDKKSQVRKHIKEALGDGCQQ